ncbi:MAG: hypothetical protein AAGE52_22295 [Myxococcota bacterium]
MTATLETLKGLSTWTVLSETKRMNALSVFAPAELLSLGEDNQLSRDGGRTWTVVELPGKGRSGAGNHASTSAGTFYSEDGWRSWTKTLDAGLENLCVLGDKRAFGIVGGKVYEFVNGEWDCTLNGGRSRIRSLAANAQTSSAVAVAGKGTVWHRDSGGEWTQHPIAGAKSLQLIRLFPLDLGFVGITNHPHTLWWSADGETWKKSSPLPWHWAAISRGDSLLMTGGNPEGDWFVQAGDGTARIEPYEPTPVCLLASGPDDQGDETCWGLAQLDSKRFVLMMSR